MVSFLVVRNLGVIDPTAGERVSSDLLGAIDPLGTYRSEEPVSRSSCNTCCPMVTGQRNSELCIWGVAVTDPTAWGIFCPAASCWTICGVPEPEDCAIFSLAAPAASLSPSGMVHEYFLYTFSTCIKPFFVFWLPVETRWTLEYPSSVGAADAEIRRRAKGSKELMD